ncbi:MAG: 50S ribosomal protein L25/general stress protein Ctc [Propionibacteriaceae bacterium]|nr:50S ribosomal protein L25/general stress protein Ctc [Propionibacteriaceae bacterium]
MANLKLAATTRTEFGKGAARKLRRADLIPAVIYGHGTDPVHVSLPNKDTFLALRNANVLLEITIDDAKKPVLTLPKQVQRDPLTGFLEHVDLLLVKASEKVAVDVPINFVGEPAGKDSLVNHELMALPVLAPATSIPSEIEVSVDGLEVGAQITVADLTLPEGVEAAVEADHLVVTINIAAAEPVETAEDAEGAAAEGDAAE